MENKKIREATVTVVHNFPEKLRSLEIIKCAETGVTFIRKDLFTSAVAEFLESDAYKQLSTKPEATDGNQERA